MNRKRLNSIVLAAAFAAMLIASAESWAQKAKKPGGGGGGGNNPITPAWVIIDDGNLKLMSSNGLDTQQVGTGKVVRYATAPAWSPDGNWIAYIQAPNIRMVRPDGSNNQSLAEFSTNDDRLPISSYGLQWVPGEVDRIIYCGRDDDIYVVSTVVKGAPQPLGLRSGGATLSPDLHPETPGYQGALAHIDWYSRNIVILRAEDGASGIEIDYQSAVEVSSLFKNQSYPAWSNDGLGIAFVYGDRGDYSLEVLPVLVAPDAITLFEEDIRTLDYNNFAQGIFRPRWAPDDSWIAYIAQTGGEPSGESALHLFRVRSDGQSLPVNVTNGDRRQTYVDWDPLWVNDID